MINLFIEKEKYSKKKKFKKRAQELLFLLGPYKFIKPLLFRNLKVGFLVILPVFVFLNF